MAAVDKIEEMREPEDFIGHRNRMAPVRTLVQKLRAGKQFLARRRVHRHQSAVCKCCEMMSIFVFSGSVHREFAFYYALLL